MKDEQNVLILSTVPLHFWMKHHTTTIIVLYASFQPDSSLEPFVSACLTFKLFKSLYKPSFVKNVLGFLLTDSDAWKLNSK